ncbi:Ef-hand calcium-binding domain protein [Lasiodiplodia theobromae]|uniref:Ef-hand calcium-binding domain protein n=1 Tax=Lasiodiplodia theobromae TaxID=45133 RepID=UPI0015C39C0B|nr:Ef-hand calcium-binding domain protein [Lasiodiplodia theobromae]KAF4545107.1 Ef-hand calcium-binding domain protein [Lasiodiplodia theobromae]
MASTDRTAKIRIVCLHGFSCNSAIYRFQTARLRKRWAEHLRQHPLVAATSSSSPSSTSSSSRAASPGLDDPWQRNNTQYYYDSDEESSSAATTTSSSSSVDLAASISSRSSISFSSDYPPPPSYSSSGSTNGGNSGSGVVVYNDVEFIFLESPREVSTPEQPLAEVASLFPGPYRTWFEPSTTTSKEARRTSSAKPDDGRRARRRDPAVERWVVEQVKRAGGVHGVLAFSDGAALTAALTLKAEAGVAACPKLWDFVVLACGVDPYPDPWLHGINSGSSADGDEEEAKEEEEAKCLARLKTPGLHIVGLRDEVYRDRSEALWGLVHPQAAAAAADRDEKGMNAASGMAAEVYRFDDGHKVPVQDTDLDAILSAWRRVVVRSGLFRDASPDEVVAASRVLAV